MHGSRAIRAATDPLHTLTEKQRVFVDYLVKGDSAVMAARKAGYANPESNGPILAQKPNVQAALKFAYKKHAQASQMTRKRVIDGLLEAIEMGKMQADGGVMVAGWREIGKMCGFYAPEVKRIDISVTTRRVIGELEVLSDDALLQLVDDTRSGVIEGVAEAVEALDEADPPLPPDADGLDQENLGQHPA